MASGVSTTAVWQPRSGESACGARDPPYALTHRRPTRSRGHRAAMRCMGMLPAAKVSHMPCASRSCGLGLARAPAAPARAPAEAGRRRARPLACVQTKRAQTSASWIWLSGGFSQRQITPRAPASPGQLAAWRRWHPCHTRPVSDTVSRICSSFRRSCHRRAGCEERSCTASS
eukprot:scaffold18419_cov66-Phaeocystis_antarctica.AAC.4